MIWQGECSASKILLECSWRHKKTQRERERKDERKRGKKKNRQGHILIEIIVIFFTIEFSMRHDWRLALIINKKSDMSFLFLRHIDDLLLLSNNSIQLRCFSIQLNLWLNSRTVQPWFGVYWCQSFICLVYSPI